MSTFNLGGGEAVFSDKDLDLDDLGTLEEKETKEETEEEDEEEEEEDVDTSEESILDKWLFVWHCVVMGTCLLLLILGIVLRYKFTDMVMNVIEDLETYAKYSHFVRLESAPDDLIFGDLVPILGNSLITLNASYLLCILFYMSFLIDSTTFTLPLVIVLTGVVILIEINIINIYMSPVSAASEDSTATLREKLIHQYAIDDSTIFSVTYDIIAIWGGCCGIVDQFDFQNMELKYVQKATERKTLQVPPTCCTRAVFEKEPTDVLECATKAENIYLEGCYVTLYNWLRQYCNIYSLIIIMKLVDMCIHIALYKMRVHECRETHNLQMVKTLSNPAFFKEELANRVLKPRDSKT